MKGGSIYGQICYRLIWIYSTVAYSLSLYQRFQGEIPSFYVLLEMDSFQYGALGFFWLFTSHHFIKILPFAVFALLQGSEFIATDVMPGSSLAKKIQDFQAKYSNELMVKTTYINLLIILRLVLDLLLIKNGALLSLGVFAFYFRIRIAYSEITQNVLKDLEQKIDVAVSKPKTPKKIKDIWAKVKDMLFSHASTSTLDPKEARRRAELMKELREKEIQEELQAQEAFKKNMESKYKDLKTE